MCRTYQRLTKAKHYSCHSIKEETLNKVVIMKLKDICINRIDKEKLRLIADEEIKNADNSRGCINELEDIKLKITTLNNKLDRTYTDHLRWLLLEKNFSRIYQKTKLKGNL